MRCYAFVKDNSGCCLRYLFPPAVANYKVLHKYEPQNEDDLALDLGDWVTLEETPYGGGWWRGSVEGRGTGWFPKTYVEYVDREAERKRRQDGESVWSTSGICL